MLFCMLSPPHPGFNYTSASYFGHGHKGLNLSTEWTGNALDICKSHRKVQDDGNVLTLYLQVPLLQAGRLTRYARSMCSCPMSSGFTLSTQRQAAFSSCKRGAMALRCIAKALSQTLKKKTTKQMFTNLALVLN